MSFSSRECCLFTAAMMVAVTSCTAPGGTDSEGPATSGPVAQSSASAQQETTLPSNGDRLPDLVMLPLEGFHVAYEGDHKVLRFTANVLNGGNGPLDVTGSRAGVMDLDLSVSQNILKSDGSHRTVKTKAIMRYETVDGHDHFHVQDFERYQIRPENGSTWTGSRKEGFCLRDDANLQGKPSRYDDANFDCGTDEKETALKVRQGLSEGWVDVYDWYLEGQYIELKDLDLPGNFCVQAEADPGRALTEATRENNVTSALLRISESDVSVIRQNC
jgi:hypothetical protein